MEIMKKKPTKITVGDLELWTAPFGTSKATITAVEGGAKVVLQNLHTKLPDVFELFVDDEDFSEEDMNGAFSVIVDPKKVGITVYPGEGKLGFTVSPDCDGDCEHCEYKDCDKTEVEKDE